MCGIVGYVGNKDACPYLIGGLRRLEYRGYDSAGIATLRANDGFRVTKVAGRVELLESAMAQRSMTGQLGIGHTRWATHGAATEENAHPHSGGNGIVTIAHNGVIENYDSLKQTLIAKGYRFVSQTDSEVVAHLIAECLKLAPDAGVAPASVQRYVDAVQQTLPMLRGTYGLAIMFRDQPDLLIAARCGSPLVIGVGKNEQFLASDTSPLVGFTERIIYLADHQIAILRPDNIQVLHRDQGRVRPDICTLSSQSLDVALEGYAHYMLKEIHEQPAALRNCLAGRLDVSNARVTLGALSGMGRELGRIKRVLLTGCGTAWHACLVGEYLFEELARLPTNVEYASELRYRNPIVEEGTLGIVVSQSGETADTLAALHEIRLKGATVFGVVNVVGSTIARETDAGVYLHAGPEIGVASTKAFTAQVAVLAMLAADLGRRGHLSPERTAEFLAALQRIPDQVAIALGTESQAKAIAERLAHRDNWLYLGRGVNYPVALEGALKLKEISYIHAEGMPAAEMKHGPIALIEAGMPVVVVAPRDHTYEKVVANVEEVRGRRGLVIAVVSEGDTVLRYLADEVIVVPETLPLLSPLLTTIPLQFIAYYAALARGMNVDKPRNLAKSVTVE